MEKHLHGNVMLCARYTRVIIWVKDQPCIKSGETSFRMKEEVESLVHLSNVYPYKLYGERVGEMEENAKSPRWR